MDVELGSKPGASKHLRRQVARAKAANNKKHREERAAQDVDPTDLQAVESGAGWVLNIVVCHRNKSVGDVLKRVSDQFMERFVEVVAEKGLVGPEACM